MEQMLQLHGIAFDLPRIGEARRRAGAVRLFLFGSILTDRFRPDSDIDLLVETDPLHPPGLLALGGLQMDLSELLGRTVHLTLLGGVPPGDRSAVLARARLLDAA
jgi:predicted nucleotidyltransferase